jgi:hypothetical protein
MSVTIELAAELEAELSALAAAQGLALPQYVQHLLEEQIFVRLEPLSPAERAAASRASVARLPIRPPLSDTAISRDSIYDARG